MASPIRGSRRSVPSSRGGESESPAQASSSISEENCSFSLLFLGWGM